MRVVFLTLVLILHLYAIRADSLLSSDGYDDLPRTEEFSPVDVPELIAQDNYPVETHNVTTEDGYILTIFRIPGAEGAKTVLVQGGLLESSVNWLIIGKNKSLAYILSDLGYDVWLGNARGSTYSLEHETLNTSDPKYWDFSQNELAEYDLPAVITYITDLKNDKIFYVGHSMGGSTFAAMASENPEVAQKVKLMVGLAPSVYINHMRSPLRLIAPFWKEIMILAKSVGIYKILRRDTIIDEFAKTVCQTILIRHALCDTVLSLIGGPDLGEVDPSVLPKVYSTFPAGTSDDVIAHFAQQIVGKPFSKFDHGLLKNLAIYGKKKPPSYDLSKVRVPVVLFYAANDWLVDPKDVKRLYKKFRVRHGIYGVESDKFSHLDFVWGRDAPELVYPKVTEILENFSENKTTS